MTTLILIIIAFVVGERVGWRRFKSAYERKQK